jgi:hypothetical protein
MHFANKADFVHKEIENHLLWKHYAKLDQTLLRYSGHG